jgi:phasin
MQENVAREFADRSVESVTDTYGKVQAVAQETTKVMERTYSATTKSAADFNLHFLEVAQANMNSAFDFARQLTGIKSPSEFFELSTAYARKQFETFTEQSQRLTSLAQKTAADAAQPLQSEVAKTFKKSA